MIREHENVILPFEASDPDFGELLSVCPAATSGARFGDFVVAGAMSFGIYRNGDGFTAWPDAFPLHFGYGDSPEDAAQASATYLAHSRRLYGGMPDDEGTRCARLLRGKLCAYLVRPD